MEQAEVVVLQETWMVEEKIEEAKKRLSGDHQWYFKVLPKTK